MRVHLRRGAVALIALAVLAAPAAAQARTPPTALIAPGQAIAGVHIGDTRARVTALWGPPLVGCRRRPTWIGTVCEQLNNVNVTYDGTGHVVGIDASIRLNVTQTRIVRDAVHGFYATRDGIGPGVAQNVMLRRFGSRARLLPRSLYPGFGGVDRAWVVRGPAHRLTLFGVVGANRGPRGGQITHVTVARELTPVVAGPARISPGETPTVTAQDLVPGHLYQLQATFPEAADPIPLATVRADASGRASAPVSYDGTLALQLAATSTATAGDVAGRLRAVPLDGVQAPAPDDRRAFWLGSLAASAPVALAAPVTTMSVDPPGPVPLETALTVRFGGIVPTTFENPQAPGLTYGLIFQAPCGAPDVQVFVEPVNGVVSLTGAGDNLSPLRSVRFACNSLPAGQPVTVPLVLYREIDLTSGLEKRIAAATVAMTFTRP